MKTKIKIIENYVILVIILDTQFSWYLIRFTLISDIIFIHFCFRLCWNFLVARPTLPSVLKSCQRPTVLWGGLLYFKTSLQFFFTHMQILTWQWSPCKIVQSIWIGWFEEKFWIMFQVIIVCVEQFFCCLRVIGSGERFGSWTKSAKNCHRQSI